MSGEHEVEILMWVTATLSSSTFKPAIDKCMAADGTDVIVWASERVLIRLGYRNGSWELTRHAPAQAADDARSRQGAFCWCGRFYAEQGEPVVELGDVTSDADWERVYAECVALGGGRGSLAAAN